MLVWGHAGILRARCSCVLSINHARYLDQKGAAAEARGRWWGGAASPGGENYGERGAVRGNELFLCSGGGATTSQPQNRIRKIFRIGELEDGKMFYVNKDLFYLRVGVLKDE